MKGYTVRLSFTDRKFGPGCGRMIHVNASSFHTALKKATHEFWKSLAKKQRNDVRCGGLKAEVREIQLDSSSEV